jgi:NAD(P)-dependent dehydrogenase (short-subunit alcohol dehydrogenase family)
MAGELEGRTALVTGGRRGLGRAIAQRLAASGAHVAILDAEPVDAVVDAIAARGGRAFGVMARIGEAGAVPVLLAGLDAGFPDGRVDILVNNIGGGDYRTFETTDVEFLDSTWGLNVRIPFIVTQALLERLNDGGRVVNISSAGARLALPEVMAYSMAKSAVETFTRILAKILGPRGITVNSVGPGLTNNETNAEVLSDEGARQAIAGDTLLGRVGEPEDIADVVYALVSPRMRWVTGQHIDASGGFRM